MSTPAGGGPGGGAMILDIHFGKDGRSGEILVHPGDDPLLLAQEFAAKHKIKDKAVPLIRNHVESFLADMNRQVAISPAPTLNSTTGEAPTAKERLAARLAAKREQTAAKASLMSATTVTASNVTGISSSGQIDSSNGGNSDAVGGTDGGLINVQLSFGAQSPVEISPIKHNAQGLASVFQSPPLNSLKGEQGTELDSSWQAEEASPQTPPSRKSPVSPGARSSVYPYGYPPAAHSASSPSSASSSHVNNFSRASVASGTRAGATREPLSKDGDRDSLPEDRWVRQTRTASVASSSGSIVAGSGNDEITFNRLKDTWSSSDTRAQPRSSSASLASQRDRDRDRDHENDSSLQVEVNVSRIVDRTGAAVTIAESAFGSSSSRGRGSVAINSKRPMNNAGRQTIGSIGSASQRSRSHSPTRISRSSSKSNVSPGRLFSLAESQEQFTLAPAPAPAHSQSQPPRSISERLYRNAAQAKRHRDKLKADADEQLARELEQTRFRIGDESRRLCGSKRAVVSRSSHAPDVLSRLYTEGLKEVADKKKLPETTPTYLEDWSCAQCGTFHTVRFTFDGVALGHGRGDKDKKLTCSRCGFEQPTAAPHRPAQLIHMHMNQQDKDEMLRRAKERQLMRDHQKSLQQRVAPKPTYKPQIPQESKRILQASIAREKGKESNKEAEPLQHSILASTTASASAAASASASASAPAAAGTSISVSTALSGSLPIDVPISQYFQEDIYSRLVANKRPVVRRTTHLPLSFAELMGEEEHKDTIEGSATTATAAAVTGDHPDRKKGAQDLTRFIDRLTYEYLEKDAKRELRLQQPQRDPITGAPLFQPSLPSQGKGSYGIAMGVSTVGGEHNGSGGGEAGGYKRYMREKGMTAIQEAARAAGLNNKDYTLAQAHAQAQAQAQAAEEELLAAAALAQPKALPRSEQILAEASAKAVEVMFRVLLAGNLMPLQPGSGDGATIDGSGNADNGISLLLKHDHENWQNEILDLSRVRSDILVPDLVEFVGEVRAELAKVNAALPLGSGTPARGDSSGAGSSAERVSFELFSKLVRRVLGRGAAAGLHWRRAFIVTPHSRRTAALAVADNAATANAAAAVAAGTAAGAAATSDSPWVGVSSHGHGHGHPHINNNDGPLTFRPQLAPHTEVLAQAKKRPDSAEVHEHLFAQAVKLKRRHDEAAAAHKSAEADREVTRPHMYPPPKGIQPRYRHSNAAPGPGAVMGVGESSRGGKTVIVQAKVKAAKESKSLQPSHIHLHHPVSSQAPSLVEKAKVELDGKGRAIPPPLPCENVRSGEHPSVIVRSLFLTPE